MLINGEDIPVSAQKEAQRTNAERNEAVDSLDKIVVEEVALIQRVIKLGKASKDTALITKLASEGTLERNRNGNAVTIPPWWLICHTSPMAVYTYGYRSLKRAKFRCSTKHHAARNSFD